MKDGFEILNNACSSNFKDHSSREMCVCVCVWTSHSAALSAFVFPHSVVKRVCEKRLKWLCRGDQAIASAVCARRYAISATHLSSPFQWLPLYPQISRPMRPRSQSATRSQTTALRLGQRVPRLTPPPLQSLSIPFHPHPDCLYSEWQWWMGMLG